MKTETQISAGGVAVRSGPSGPEVALIAVGPTRRWQLPKGMVEPKEPPESAAIREVREEAGIETELVAPLEKIEYWYVGTRRAASGRGAASAGGGAGGERVRYHKYVHFFLLRYLSGDVRDHDHEVEESRWVSFAQAKEMIAFASERRVVEAAERIVAGSGPAGT